MTNQEKIRALAALGNKVEEELQGALFQEICSSAGNNNKWFSTDEVHRAFNAVRTMLTVDQLESWCRNYNIPDADRSLNIGVVMAGNIPLVGFHDALTVLLSGNILHAKYASDDNILMPYLLSLLVKVEPRFADRIVAVGKLADVDAVIATGSDNSARYFEYYFRKTPHIIRKNRNSVAVLTGDESEQELKALGNDIFNYYGLGCRNVSKLYLPKGYNIDKIFEAVQDFSFLMNSSKYMNNYDYSNAVLLLKQVPFLTNNFLIMMEDTTLSCSVSILNYEYYEDQEILNRELSALENKIQCKVSISPVISDAIPPGLAQKPRLWDYADGVDTMKFLLEL